MGISMTQQELVSVSVLTVSLWIVHAEYHLARLTLYTEQTAAARAQNMVQHNCVTRESL
jgi:hypothetical protein